MASRPTSRTPDADALRRALGAWGVGLFVAAREGAPGAAHRPALPALMGDLARSADARLRAAIPCLLAVAGPEAGRRAVVEAAAKDPTLGERLGYLHRLARALVLSRAPDLARLLGRAPVLEAVPFEPGDLPAPEESLGEATLREASLRAREAHETDVAGGVEREFDTWLSLVAAERRAVRA